MDVDLGKVRGFSITIEENSYEVRLADIGPEGELYFQPVKPINRGNFLSTEGRVAFSLDEKSFTFIGDCFMPTLDRVVVIRKSEIVEDVRSKTRYKVEEMPCVVKQKKFLDETVIDGFIEDISENGALIKTREPLENNLLYTLETTLGKARFTSGIFVRSSKEADGFHINGALFHQTTPENQHVLRIFNLSLSGRLQVRDLGAREEKQIGRMWKRFR